MGRGQQTLQDHFSAIFGDRRGSWRPPLGRSLRIGETVFVMAEPGEPDLGSPLEKGAGELTERVVFAYYDNQAGPGTPSGKQPCTALLQELEKNLGDMAANADEGWVRPLPKLLPLMYTFQPHELTEIRLWIDDCLSNV